MLKNNSYILFPVLFILLFAVETFAQEVNIVPYLKKIEDGKKESVQAALPKLKSEHPGDPSVMFLEGVLTENGQQAVAIYNKIIKNYPHSRYADAALYRVYSYYYALGMYSVANDNLKKLKKDYPRSPYIKLAQNKIPGKDNVVAGSKSIGSPEPKAVKDTSALNTDSKFTIQAGAFSVLKNAEALQKSFKKSGYTSMIEEKVVAGTSFHIVYVGQYVSESDAQKALQVINSKFNLNGRVIQTNR